MNALLPHLVALAPELILAVTAVVLAFAEYWWPRRVRSAIWWSLPVLCIGILVGVWWGGRAWITSGLTGRPGNPVVMEMIAVVLALVLIVTADGRGKRDESTASLPSWIARSIILLGVGLALWRVLSNGRSFDGGVMTPIFPIGTDGEDQVLRLDAFAATVRVIVLAIAGTAAAWMWLPHAQGGDDEENSGSYWSATAIAVVAGLLLVSTENVIVIWGATECAVLAVSTMTRLAARDKLYVEASTKLFTAGGLATAIMLVGIALLYGYAGGLSLDSIGIGFEDLENTGAVGLLAGFGWVCFFSGLLWKIAAVPFHFGSVDVVEVGPFATRTHVAVLWRIVGIAVFLRALMASSGSDDWTPGFAGLVAWIAALTMTWGNLGALRQARVHRLVSYMSIAQVGMILAGVGAFYAFDREDDETGTSVIVASYASDDATVATLISMLAFALAFVGFCACLSVFVESRRRSRELDGSIQEMAGLGLAMPSVSIPFVIFVVSLIGVPPTVGFVARLELVRVVLARPDLTWLGLVLVVNVVLMLAYVAPVVAGLMQRRADTPVAAPSRGRVVMLWILALATIGLGVLPGGMFEMAKAAALGLRF